MKKAFVIGLTGMDGSYMAELLLEKGYEVHGLVRRSASPNFWRIEHIIDQLKLVPGDLTDQSSLDNAIRKIQPNEIYNLGAQSYVHYSFQAPIATADPTALGCLRLLESIRNFAPEARFFQASTSEMFGKIQESPQKETTRFYPRSPYGAAKAFAHHATVNYREAYKLHASCGIMFNHESPRRGEEFVTRKITLGVARYKKSGIKLRLGNLNASRDWSHAKEMMEAAWLMLQQEKPDDYVLASGVTHTVKQWLEAACEAACVDFWEAYMQDTTFERQAEVEFLKGDASKAKKVLGWEPKITFEQLVHQMVKADEEYVRRER